jgi:hypothetical protein
MEEAKQACDEGVLDHLPPVSELQWVTEEPPEDDVEEVGEAAEDTRDGSLSEGVQSGTESGTALQGAGRVERQKNLRRVERPKSSKQNKSQSPSKKEERRARRNLRALKKEQHV